MLRSTRRILPFGRLGRASSLLPITSSSLITRCYLQQQDQASEYSQFAFGKTYLSGARFMAEPSVAAPEANDGSTTSATIIHPVVVFVLGGPGSGKGTQCSKIVERFGFVHLSAGDLLRAEIDSGSENGTMISNMIKEGKIVPSEVTVRLLQRAMAETGKDKFLIDGFPRNEENRAAFETVTGIDPAFILFFDCRQEEMEVRLLGRNQGRVDDNIETIRKRFRVFIDSSLPVVSYYESKGKVRKIDAAKTKDEVFESIQDLFVPYIKIRRDSKLRRLMDFCVQFSEG